MALQELLERWQQQPPGREIETAVRSVFGYSRNRIFRYRPATTTVIEPTLFASTPIYRGRDGEAGNYNGTSSGWYASAVLSGIPSEATLLALVRPAVADSSERTILSLSNVADENPLFRLETEGSNKYRFQIRGTVDAANITGTTSVVAGTTAVVGGVFRDSTREKSVWVNGRKEATASNNVGSASFSRTTLGVLSRSGTVHYFSGLIFEAHVLPFAASDGWMAEATRSPIALLNAIYKPRRIWVPVSAGGAADLTLADASHAHAADSLSLTTASTLTIADATHAHTAEALSLTTASTLAVADALHDHAAEGLALTTESLLALQDALHDHAADAPELLSGSSLLIAEALQAHTADGLALVVDAYLTVANAGHGHTADALVLTVPSTGADPAAVWSYVLSNGKTAEENVVEILAKLQALHDIHGLTLGSPLTVSATARAAGTISQTISSSSGTTTVTRTS